MTARIMRKSARFKLKRIPLFYLLLQLPGSTLPAQSPIPDSLAGKTLPEFLVMDRQPELSGYNTWKPDSIPQFMAVSLADRLLWENAIDVRSNGPGVLSTLSIRGAGPNRTPIFWNGISLLSPMNGVMDASLVPVWPTDQLDVQFGGQSALQSSGAMGGSVKIVQGLPGSLKGWEGSLQTAAGSFNRWDAGAALGWNGPRFSSTARIMRVWAENDFSFLKQGLDGRFYPAKQPNNAVQRFDFQQFNTWKIHPAHTLGTSYWRQDAYRELPPANTEAPKNTWQTDCSHRFILHWDAKTSNRSSLQNKLAYLHDDLAFYLSGDTDTSKSRQLIWITEYSWKQKFISWKTGANAMHQWVQVDGYSDSIKWFGQTRLSAYGMGAWRLGKLSGVLLLRQEYAESQAAPFSGSLGAVYRLADAGAIQMHLARNFNLPTLNDRFWRNLGNINLKPEQGWSADLGWEYKQESVSAGIRMYHLVVDDWILWQPDETGLFRPGNLRKVWGRGLEGTVGWQAKWDDLSLSMSSRWQWSATTHVAVYGGSENVLGKQLPYTSRFTAGNNLSMRYKTYSLTYLQQITGKRPDVVGKPLPGFTTGTLLASISWFRQRLILDIRCENIWNTRYEIFRFRPMPGRSWRLGLAYQFGRSN